MKSLDMNRSFAEHCGGIGIRRYSQDGVDFDAAGNEIGGVEEPAMKVIPLELQVEALLRHKLTHTEIAEQLGVTRQKVTRIATQLSK